MIDLDLRYFAAPLVSRLRALVDRVRDAHPSPIIPFVIGDETATLDASRALLDRGCEVHTFPGTEVCINGSGGPTCITRPILRG